MHAVLRLQIFDEAIRLSLSLDFRERLHAYYRRGLAKYNLDQYEDAIVDLDEALRLIKQGDPESLFSEITELRAEAENLLNFYETGIVNIDERIRQEPHNIRDYKIPRRNKRILGTNAGSESRFRENLRTHN